MIDPNAIQQKIYRNTQADGIVFIYAALLFGFYADLCNNMLDSNLKRVVVSLPVIYFFVFSVFIIEFIRRKLTWPRIGYFKTKDDIKPAFLFTVVFPIAFFPMVLYAATRFLDYQRIPPALPWVTLAFGLLFASLFWGLSVKTGQMRYRVLAVAAFSLGAGFAALLPGRLGLILFLLIMAGILAVLGVAMMVIFVRTHPKRDEEAAHEEG